MAAKQNNKIAVASPVEERAAEQKELEAAFEAALFAKNVKAPIYLLEDASTKQNATFTRYTKEQLVSWMQRPSSNEKNLRNASIYMYDCSLQYQRLIEHFASLLTWDHYISPTDIDRKTTKPEALTKAYQKALEQVSLMNLPHELQKASLVVLREGVFYGAIWQNKTSFFVQRINPDYCTLTSIEDGTWRYAVDMSKISEKKLPLYPPEFTKMYNDYKNGGNKYQEVPTKITFCLKWDETTPNYSVPPFAPALPMLYDLETYKALQETATKIENYKILGMQIPMSEDGAPKVPWEQAERYYQQLCNVLPSYVGAFVSPMKTESYTFEKSGAANQVDVVSRAEAQYWGYTGTSALLHGSTLANTAGTLKLAIKSDEALMFLFENQVERLINRILKDISGTIKFHINFLPITIFNQSEMVDLYEHAASLGIPGAKTMYAASIGVGQQALTGMERLESALYDLDDWQPVRSSYNSSSVGNGKAGRPEKDATDLDDEGEKTRENGTNDDR